MIVLAFQITNNGEKAAFDDVANGDWYFDYVSLAYNAGFIKGDENNSFNPETDISRQDISVMLYRAATTYGIPLNISSLSYNDEKTIGDYAEEAVGALSGSDIINGFEDGSFRPNEPATRAQAAQLLYRLLKYGNR